MDFRIGAIPETTYVPGLQAEEAASNDNVFKSFFDAALDVVKDTNQTLRISDRIQQDFAMGKTDDFLSVLLASDRANSMLNFTTQVTNKIIESYRELMRMQI
jgi:flagellar hook-basal body complex protein FliE